MKNFKTVLQELFAEAIADEKERLLDKNEEDYFQGYDEDYINVGVGCVCVRREKIYNERKLEEDAKENVINDILTTDCAFETICQNDKFLEALAQLLREL